MTAVDDLLAERTAERFLSRLAAGELASASRLYLTDRAQAGDAGRIVAQLGEGGGNPHLLVGASLLQVRRATSTSYEARALLHWRPDGAQAPVARDAGATQPVTLRLAYSRGLWLIDSISLGDRQIVVPTPTARPKAGEAGYEQPTPELEGRLVFQASSGGDIYVIDADGSGLVRLTDGLDPAWSPDGTQIAFSRWRDAQGIYVINADGSGEKRVVAGDELKEPAWSPDGKRLVYSHRLFTIEGGEYCFWGICFEVPPLHIGQVWVANLENGGFLSLPLNDYAVHAPTWDPLRTLYPARDRIVYAGNRGLAWIDLLDGGDVVETSWFEQGSVWDSSPTFSPDGQKIAFMGRVHTRWEVFVMNADGSGRMQLTNGDPKLDPPPSNVAPAWSPDGRQIAFVSNRDGPWRVYVMDATGGQQRPMFGAALDGLGLNYEWASERVLSWTW